MPDTELIICDTSVVGVVERAATKPERIAHWPDEDRSRLDGAVLAISVVTEAEVRAGWIYAGWGERRTAAAELRLFAYVSIPVDRRVLDVWPELHAAGRASGWNVGHNDLWIAATAIALGLPLASCDSDHQRIEDERLDLLYLPVDPD